MGRYVSCLVLSFLLIGVCCQDDAPTSPIPDSESTIISDIKDDGLMKESGICRVCICKYGIVNCKDQNLEIFFTFEEWENITDIKPTIVDLSHNALVNVAAFAALPIEKLDLSNNRIENIEHGSFSNLRVELRVLDLSHNKLTSKLSPHAFEGKYDPETYEPLLSMRTLSLAYNKFDTLNSELFMHLPDLTSLDLSGNPLTTIDHETFIAITSLPMLRDLRLRSCQLIEIPERFLYIPRYLEHLDLSDNQLTMVPQELEETTHLVYLNMNQNLIEELDMSKQDALGFPTLHKLQELHLSHMPKLRRIGAGALGGLENLAKLHLSFNPKLSDIDPNALARVEDVGDFYNWPLVRELYLQSNNLSKVDRRLISRWDILVKLDLSGNPFLCDCNAQWMVDQLVPIIEQLGVDESEKLVCQEPIEMRGHTMKHLHDIHRTMRCVEKYGKRQERNTAIPLVWLPPLSFGKGDRGEL